MFIRITFTNIYNREKFEQTKKYAQTWLDNEVIKLVEPYTPLLTGALRNSASLNSKIGDGVIVWATPYARRRYYETRIGSPRGAKRGGFWFERMKKDHYNYLKKQVTEIFANGI